MSKSPSDRKQAGGYAMPISISSEKAAAKVDNAKRAAIFELDGIIYDMPAVPRADIALTYLDLMDAEGEDAAALYLLTETIGRAGFDALKAVKGLSDEDFEGVMVRVKAIALPKGETPTPKRSRG